MSLLKKSIVFSLMIAVFIGTLGTAMAVGPTTTDKYNKPIPCLTQKGVCVMQTGEACDTAGGKKLDCKDCEECKKKGLVK